MTEFPIATILWTTSVADRKRGWHDKLAGTVVVDTGKPAT